MMQYLVIFLPVIDPGTDANGNLVFEGTMFALLLINVLLNIPIDVISSWGMYRIAKRRGLPCPWLAWIPLVNLWTLGSIADQYKLEMHDRRGWSRYILLGLQLFVVLSCLAGAGTGVLATVLWDVILKLEVILISFLLVAIITVFCSLYRLYDSCLCSFSGLFTALSVLFSIPTPFLILLSSRWDDE